jgi:pyrimidine-nucleoside phosphorylase
VNPTELIRKKRQGETLTRDELQFLIDGYLRGDIPDYQISAFLMSVYFRGMSFEETALFTDIMLRSGNIVDLTSVPGIKVDKHSTGGVGDKVSLILAPMVAACGVPVPMISGRGLGHTGGTLDKLESIPGFRTSLSLAEYESVIRAVGLVMIGQTAEIAPADKKMYALRDVTATVESIPLIAGSIMSKKLAEGIDALVLDIKTGRGAFMETEERAVELATTLIAVGKRFGKRTLGFITDMNEPLGYAVGNWLEVRECVECLQGREIADLMEVTSLLGGAMLFAGGKSPSIEEGVALCHRSILDGSAWKKFLQLVRAQGGSVTALENLPAYPVCKESAEIKSYAAGFVTSIDALETGYCSILLGAGRMTVGDPIDPKAGILLHKKVGDPVAAGETLAEVFTDRRQVIGEVAERLGRAITVAERRVAPPALIHAFVDEMGVHPWKNGKRR